MRVAALEANSGKADPIMAKTNERRGSAMLGSMMLISVFGPMLILTVLWGIAAASGASGVNSSAGPSPFRDAVMDLMIWVLSLSGIGMTVQAVLIAIFRGLKRGLSR